MSEQIERPAALAEEHLQFLDELRESGVTNMFGAGIWLSDEFGISRKDAHKILNYWMKTFSERSKNGK